MKSSHLRGCQVVPLASPGCPTNTKHQSGEESTASLRKRAGGGRLDSNSLHPPQKKSKAPGLSG